MQVVSKRLTIRGFIVSDSNMSPKYAKEHQENVQKWIADDSIKAKMSLTNGIGHAAEGLRRSVCWKARISERLCLLLSKRWTE
jgi:NADPH-dependent curcumin reductase CurA